MARISNGALSGALGNMVFYTMAGVGYVRSKPGKQIKRRNQSFKLQSSSFGLVSKYGTRMIKELSRELLFTFGLKTYNQSRGWMRNQYFRYLDQPGWDIGDRGVDMCQLNQASDLRDFFGTRITVKDNGSGEIEFSIPSLNPKRDLKAPPLTDEVNLKFILQSSAFGEESRHTKSVIEVQHFYYKDVLMPGKNIKLSCTGAKGDIVIAAVAVEFLVAGRRHSTIETSPAWLPAAIVGMGRLK